MTSYEPLSAPEIWDIDSSASPAERLWRHVPGFGWMVADKFWASRVRPIIRKVEGQLKQRSEPDPTLWGDSVRRRDFALWLCKEMQENADWPNDHFIPDDPVYIAMWAPEDGPEYVVRQIESKLGITITEEEVIAWFGGQTVGELVDSLLAKASTS